MGVVFFDKKYIVLVLFFTLTIPSISQKHYRTDDVEIDTICVELSKLEIKDTAFIIGIDSLVLKDSLYIGRKKEYVCSFIVKKDSLYYNRIYMSLLPRSVLGKVNVLGFFKIKNYLFIIRGEKLPEFLVLTKDKESFYYTTEWIDLKGKRIRWDTMKPEEFLHWEFCYKDKILELLHSGY